jgi:uncharacterized alkaline shock family protein YloU
MAKEKKEEKPSKADTSKKKTTDSTLPGEGNFMNISESWGEIKISNEVVVTISSMAASNIEGVQSAGGKSFFGGKRDIERGITANVEGNQAVITVEIKIDFGKNIYDTVRKLQKQIKDAVEQMTGLDVEQVNVTVKGVIMPENEVQPMEKEEEEES